MTTTADLTALLLPRFSEFLAQQTGLYFPPERERDLRRGIEAAARAFGLQDAAACMQWLLSAPLDRKRIETLACHLTVGETYFFRDPPAFDALQMHILPALIQSRRHRGQTLKIWSAGCSTGEEAYTLAILVQRLIPDFRQWRISILGTDINPNALAKAKSGIYGEWSFRNAPDWLKKAYFHPLAKDRYEIIPSVREMVTFAYLNLMESSSEPSLTVQTDALDIVFCRNVLMYFEPAQAARVMGRICRALADGGWLVASPAELSGLVPEAIETVNFSGATLYRKNAYSTVLSAGMASFARSDPSEQFAIGPVAATKTLKRLVRRPVVNEQPAPRQSSDYQQALALYRQGRYREAAEVAALISDRQNKVRLLNLLARIHANQGDLASARQWCMQALDADRLDPMGHYLMAVVLLEQGQVDAGKEELKRTLYLDSDFVLAHFMLGTLYRRQGCYREARKHFENALLLLDGRPPEELLPEAEGVTAGRLAEIIHAMRDQEKPL